MITMQLPVVDNNIVQFHFPNLIKYKILIMNQLLAKCSSKGENVILTTILNNHPLERILPHCKKSEMSIIKKNSIPKCIPSFAPTPTLLESEGYILTGNSDPQKFESVSDLLKVLFGKK